MANGWKILAIIFMILFILENIGLVLLIQWTYQDINKENECVVNVCGDYDAYNYVEGFCECYVDGILVHNEYIN